MQGVLNLMTSNRFAAVITGIFITIVNINAPLNINTSPESIKIQKDTLHFKKLDNKTI